MENAQDTLYGADEKLIKPVEISQFWILFHIFIQISNKSAGFLSCSFFKKWTENQDKMSIGFNSARRSENPYVRNSRSVPHLVVATVG